MLNPAITHSKRKLVLSVNGSMSATAGCFSCSRVAEGGGAGEEAAITDCPEFGREVTAARKIGAVWVV